MSTNWTTAEIVFTILPPRVLCPKCQTDRPAQIVRTEQQGDGSLLRKCVCKQCSSIYKVVAEPSELPDE